MHSLRAWLLGGLLALGAVLATTGARADSILGFPQLDSGNVVKFRNPLTNSFVTVGVLSNGAIVPTGIYGYAGTFTANQTFSGALSTTGTVLMSGAGQATSSFDTTGSLGGALTLKDTGGAPNNGGTLLLAAQQGTFAAIKGLITNGGNYTTGYIDFEVRTSLTSTTLTSALTIDTSLGTTVKGNLNVAGTAILGTMAAGNASKQVVLSYNTSTNIGDITSIWQANAYTPLNINIGGGLVTIGSGGLAVNGVVSAVGTGASPNSLTLTGTAAGSAASLQTVNGPLSVTANGSNTTYLGSGTSAVSVQGALFTGSNATVNGTLAVAGTGASPNNLSMSGVASGSYATIQSANGSLLISASGSNTVQIGSTSTSPVALPGTLNVAGTVTLASTGGNGFVGAYSGGASGTPGYVAFFTGDGVRRGYLGYNSGSSQLLLEAESGFSWLVSSALQIGVTTDSTSPTTGALTDAGGLGVSKSLNVAGNARVGGTFVLDTTSSSGGLGTPTGGAYLGSGGNAISYVPLIQGVGTTPGNGPTNDHQRATGLFTATTADDGHSQENTIGVETRVVTGLASAFAASTSYAANANISANNAIYRVLSSCTSGSTAPSGFGNASQQQTNGSCTLQWVNAANLDAKLGVYSEAVTDAGGGQSWNLVLNTQLRSGATPTFNASFESDFGNNAGNCVFGVANCQNTYLRLGGAYESTHGLYIDTDVTGGHYAAHFGVRMAGLFLTQDADFETDSGGAVGFGNCSTGFIACNHPTAGYFDQSSSPIGVQLHSTATANTTAAAASSNSTTLVVASASNITINNAVTGTGIPAGTYVTAISGTTLTLSNAATVANGAALAFVSGHSVASLVDDSTSPAGLSIAGNKSYGGIYEHSTTPIGVRLNGTYSQYEIAGNGFSIDPSGNLTAASITSVGNFAANSLSVSGQATVNFGMTTDGTNLALRTNGALYVVGPTGSPAKSINVDGVVANSVSVSGQVVVGGGTAAVFANDRTTSGQAGFYRMGGINRFYDTNGGDVAQYTSSTFTINSGLASTSSTSGAFVVTGGVGIGGAVYLAGQLNLTGSSVPLVTMGSTTGTAGTANKIALYSGNYGFGVSSYSLDYLSQSNHSFYVGSTMVAQLNATALTVNDTTASAGSTSGALVVAGGVGVGGVLSVGGNVVSGGSYSSSGAAAAYTANDRSTSGNAVFYRTGGINRLYDSTAGDVIAYSATAIALNQPTTVNSTLKVTGSYTVAGASYFNVAPQTAWALDTTGNSQSLATGGTLSLPAGSGLVILSNWSNGDVGVFVMGAGNVKLISSTGGTFVAGVAASGQVGMTYNTSTSSYTITSNYGSSITLAAMLLRTRNAN